MFNKSKKTAPTQITINGTASIKNYTPNPATGNMFVCEVPDLTIITSLNPKDQRGIKKLIVTATINDPDVSTKFGDHVIVVDHRFAKISNKDQLALVNFENEKLTGVDSRFTSNFADGMDADQTLTEESARLNTAEQYGVRRTNRALEKAQHFSKKSEDRMGKYLYKAHKKESKKDAPKGKMEFVKNPFKKEPTVPEEPQILKDSAPQPSEG